MSRVKFAALGMKFETAHTTRALQCVKNVQIRSFFQSEYGKIRTRKNSVFGHFSHSVILRIFQNIFFSDYSNNVHHLTSKVLAKKLKKLKTYFTEKRKKKVFWKTLYFLKKISTTQVSAFNSFIFTHRFTFRRCNGEVTEILLFVHLDGSCMIMLLTYKTMKLLRL